MIHLGTQTLQTKRLILRRFTLNDVEAMFANWVHDPDVTKYLIWEPHRDQKETVTVVKRWLKAYKKADFYQWAIVLKDSGQPIGSIGSVNQRDDIRLMHIGYCLGQNWWHQGIMSEALAAVIKFFFEERQVNRIEARHDINNPNSGKVMASCGMKYEGTMRQSDRNNQGICDSALYAILAEDYFSRVNKNQ